MKFIVECVTCKKNFFEKRMFLNGLKTFATSSGVRNKVHGVDTYWPSGRGGHADS